MTRTTDQDVSVLRAIVSLVYEDGIDMVSLCRLQLIPTSSVLVKTEQDLCFILAQQVAEILFILILLYYSYKFIFYIHLIK